MVELCVVIVNFRFGSWHTARATPNEKEISHGRVSWQTHWDLFRNGAVGFIDWLDDFVRRNSIMGANQRSRSEVKRSVERREYIVLHQHGDDLIKLRVQSCGKLTHRDGSPSVSSGGQSDGRSKILGSSGVRPESPLASDGGICSIIGAAHDSQRLRLVLTPKAN
jgi:hypothetical protein